MTKAGADLLVCHVGLTTAGSIGAAVAFTLDEAIEKVMIMAEAGLDSTQGFDGDLPRRAV